MNKHPTQYLENDEHGVHRFVKNQIVDDIIMGNIVPDLNVIARSNYSKEDRQQLAQLIGYSASGYASLSYVDDDAWKRATESGDRFTFTEIINKFVTDKNITDENQINPEDAVELVKRLVYLTGYAE